MRTQIHPGLFLATAVALSAAWLWLRPAPQAPSVAEPRPGTAAARPAATTPSIRLEDSVLRRYAGRYDVEGFTVKISVDGERLVAEGADGGRVGLRAASETKFFFEAFPGEITFAAGEPAPGFVADLADSRHRGTRVRD